MLREAQASLSRALDLRPGLPDVGVVLAFVDLGLGDLRAAVPLLETGLDNPKNDLPVRLVGGERLVDLEFASGNDDKGVRIVEKLRKLAPDDPNVLYTAAHAYSTMWKQAVQRMYSRDPSSFRTHQVLAEAAEAKGDFSEAAKEYRIVTKLNPKLAGVHYELGQTIMLSDPTIEGMNQALVEFKKELEINPRDAPSDTQLGEINLKEHHVADAVRYFSQATQFQPAYAEARLGLGEAFLEQKQFQDAAEQLGQAIKLAPDNQTAYYDLMIAYRGLGRSAQARAALANFQRLRNQAQQQQAYTLKHLQAPLIESPGAKP
jgi:tetratricopeptide (TPR) repeat protein